MIGLQFSHSNFGKTFRESGKSYNSLAGCVLHQMIQNV